MTFNQIEKTICFIEEAKSARGLFAVEALSSKIKAFFGARFDLRLYVTTYNTLNSYTERYEKIDCQSIISFLERCLAEDKNSEVISNLLLLINEGKASLGKKDKMIGFIADVYFSYGAKISMDKNIAAIAEAPKDAHIAYSWNYESIVKGLITQLRCYASDICNFVNENKDFSSIGSIDHNITINPQIMIENKNEMSVSISQVFEHAKQSVENAGFSDSQKKEILDKLEELKDISVSKESKGKRWTRIKKVIEWIIGQSIHVAGIVLPVLSQIVAS